MALCIQFIPVESSHPISLRILDERICNLLGIAVKETSYGFDWYAYMALHLAGGMTYSKLRERLVEYENDHLLPVLDYLEANFTVRAFHSR